MFRKLILPVFVTLLLALAPIVGFLNKAGAADATVATPEPVIAAATASVASVADLNGVKTYVIEKSTALKDGATLLQQDADAYYDLAKAANFDYAALWKNNQADVVKALTSAQTHWTTISPIYEQMEGIVAGVGVLSDYDAILDAAGPGEFDYNVTLPDGKVLEKPGNLFGLLEETLWGTEKQDDAAVVADFNGNGKQDFGEVLPDANILKGGADALDDESGKLLESTGAWQPVPADVFGALATNLPTMTDFFESWKTSRFVMGNKATHNDFVVISRLSDINDNVTSWQVMWDGLAPVVTPVDGAHSAQITDGLANLRSYIDDLYAQEKGGRRFTPEEADIYSSEAQDRATAIVGQIAQIAAQLNIALPE